MKSISKIIILLFLTISTTVFSQDYKNEIEAGFNDYLNLIVTKQFDKSMDYLLPEFFDMFPREQMVEMMDQVFNNEEMEFQIKDPKILVIKDSEKVNDKFYSVLTYSNMMNMKINKPDVDENNEEEKNMYIEIMMSSFKQSFGEDNVKYNKDTEFYEIYSEKNVCAISNNGMSDWKFIVIEKGQEALLAKLLPKEILEKF